MAVQRNVRVKVRLSALESEITLRGGLAHRPGREGAQQKVVKDSPVIDIPLDEYEQRKGDVAKVITRGWQLIEWDPPEVWIGDVGIDAANLVSFNAKVVSNGWPTTCGFDLDITPEFLTDLVMPADESPVTDADPVKINLQYNAAWAEGWTFYVRAWANDGVKTVYSHVKSFEIPHL